MLYWIIKPLVFIFYRIYYKYSYQGAENIPKNKPVVLSPNHVNAFIDPVAIGLLTKRKVRFFARGDVFKGKIAKVILGSMGISPMYRLQEGYSEIKKNDKTFEECRNRLMTNKIILLFPEGICIQEKRVTPLKKGLARIVFQTEELINFTKDIQVVPVGLNFSCAWKFRSKLFIDIGKPLSLLEYRDQYKTDKVKTINHFTKVLEKKISEQLVIVENRENDELMEYLEEIYLNDFMKQKKYNVRNSHQQYLATRELAEFINISHNKHPEVVFELKEKIKLYFSKLKINNIRDHLLRPENIGKMNFISFIIESQLLLWGSIIYFIGLIFNYPPFYLGKKLADKMAKQKEFYASVYCHVAMIGWVFYFGITLLIIAFTFHNWFLLSLASLLIICLGYFCLWFYKVRKKILGRWRLLRMVRKQREKVENFVELRTEIISQINEMITKIHI